jgi:hypothetical protein
MRRWSLIAASSTFHLMTSRNCHIGITECRKLKCKILRIDLWHNVHAKFHEYPSSYYLVIKCVQVQRIVGNVPPPEFQHPSWWYCLKIEKWYFGLTINKVTSTLNFTCHKNLFLCSRCIMWPKLQFIRKHDPFDLNKWHTDINGHVPCYNLSELVTPQFHYSFSI